MSIGLTLGIREIIRSAREIFSSDESSKSHKENMKKLAEAIDRQNHNASHLTDNRKVELTKKNE
ncbi:MAG: hypothetical protein P0S95_04035 [Rhabdochlamydiaceae bacterium]|nr:hypothetical protein [Candidatus Amphrikana amoebophyrae]